MNTKVSIIDFGAIPESPQLQTDAFQKSIDFCFLNGGGEVVVPTGTYIIGDIRLRSNITLHLMENAILLGSRNPQDYFNFVDDKIEPLPKEELNLQKVTSIKILSNLGFPYTEYKRRLFKAGSRWNYGMIRAFYAENISIVGEKGSKIDGRNVYDPEGEEWYRGPHTINMHYCKNLSFTGYTVVNSGNWAHCLWYSENLEFNNLKIYGGHDGIHTRICNNVVIENCEIETGDDSIAGFDNLDVIVRDCKISSSCSAFRFGGNNILIENCDIFGPCKYPMRGQFSIEDKQVGADWSKSVTKQMLSFFTYFVQADYREPRKAPGKIIIRNCTVDNMSRFLHINLSGNEPWQKGNPPTDILFENIKATNIRTGVNAHGDGEVFFDIKFKNMEYTFSDECNENSFMRASEFGNITFEQTSFNNFKGNTFIRKWGKCGQIHYKEFNCDSKGEPSIKNEDGLIECTAI